MANEITITTSVKCANGSLSETWQPGTLQVDQATARVDGRVQAIGTSAETLDIGSDLATAGYAFVQNLDATNFVELGPTAVAMLLKLKPGEHQIVRFTTTTIHAIADTAPVDLLFRVLAD